MLVLSNSGRPVARGGRAPDRQSLVDFNMSLGLTQVSLEGKEIMKLRLLWRFVESSKSRAQKRWILDFIFYSAW